MNVTTKVVPVFKPRIVPLLVTSLVCLYVAIKLFVWSYDVGRTDDASAGVLFAMLSAGTGFLGFRWLGRIIRAYCE